DSILEFFFSSRRRHTRLQGDWSSDVCSSDLTGRRLGRGVWVFDASDTNNFVQRMTIQLRLPYPSRRYEAGVYGPFLVIRSRAPRSDERRVGKEWGSRCRLCADERRSKGDGM